MTISCKAIRSACFSLEKKTLFSRRTQSLGDGTCVLDQADFFFNIRLSPVHLFVPLLSKVITEKKILCISNFLYSFICILAGQRCQLR